MEAALRLPPLESVAGSVDDVGAGAAVGERSPSRLPSGLPDCCTCSPFCFEVQRARWELASVRASSAPTKLEHAEHIMRFTTVLSVVAAAFIAQVVAQTPPDCSGCRSPTGCPGLCSESGGNFFCTGYCGSNESFACGACEDAKSTGENCYFGTDGQCYLEDL